MRKKIISAQLAIFFPLSDIFGTGPESIASIGQQIQSALEIVGTISPLPVFPGMPLDIPRLIIDAPDNLTRYQIAGNRIDIFLNRPSEEATIDEVQSEFVRIYNSISSIISTRGLITKRIGLVTNYELLEVQNPLSFISSKFTVAGVTEQDALKEIGIRFNELSNFTSNEVTIPLNNVFSIGSEGGIPKLTIDINSLNEEMESRIFTNADTINFINSSVAMNNQWCERYFTEVI